MLIKYRLGRVHLAVAALVAVFVVVAAARRPHVVVVAIAWIYPLQLFILAYAYRLGLSGSLTRQAGYWIELAAAGLVIAAVRQYRDGGDRLDMVDLLGILYIAVVGFYRLAPHLFVHPSGVGVVGPPTGATVLNTSLRNDILFVVIFLSVKHLRLGQEVRARFLRAVFVIGVGASLAGIYEYLASNSWNHFVVHTIRVTNYQVNVLKAVIPNPLDVRVYGTHHRLQVGSFFIDRLTCGFFLVVAFAIGCEYLTRGGGRKTIVALGTALIGVGIVLVQSRDALAAAAIVIALALRPVRARTRSSRVNLGILVAATLLIVLPVSLGIGLFSRVSGSVNGSDSSTQLHVSRTSSGIKALVHQPLGRGLGTGATNGTRFATPDTLTSEDEYLQIGNETGIVSLIAFVPLTIIVNRRLRGFVGAQQADVLTGSWRGCFLALSIACLVLQVWLELPVAVVAWLGLGLALAPQTPAGGDRASPEHYTAEPVPI
jgi:hypothetical protein